MCLASGLLMRRICQIAKVFLAAFLGAMPAFATHVAVLETIGEGNVLGRSERLYLTDRLREVAVKTLPAYMGYAIMTRENISEMLPPGKTLEECEGNCLVETGKNISADFIAQARVSKFGSKMTISVELYETAKNKLVDSFTGRSSDADGLLEEVEKKAVSLFSKIKTLDVGAGGVEGFSGLQEGESFSMNANRQYLVRVSSRPEGAMLSVDGRPKCKSTPCNVQLVSGNHNFSFALDMYFDKDTSVDVQSNEQQVSVAMPPNFGVLNLEPKLGVYGNVNDLYVSIDGKVQKAGNLRLSVGKHHIEVKHECYEPISFDVSIKNGSELKFDKAMQPALGGLSLTTVGEKGPESIPVFLDGKKVGKTPYQESVPVCAKVEVGNAREVIPVKLKYHETVKYVYKGVSFGEFKDVNGNNFKTVKIGKQVWMAENLNVKMENSWCYANDQLYCEKYGRLYSWSAARTACPVGWHLPSKSEFEELFETVDGQRTACKMLKAAEGWPNRGKGIDEYSFTALPGGYRNSVGVCNYEGSGAYFWSSSEGDNRLAYRVWLHFDNDYAYLSKDVKTYGFSVRCLKD